MSEPGRRRWFQLHLSTCILLMMVAGGLLYTNMHASNFAGVPGELGLMGARVYGWPAPVYLRVVNWMSEPDYEQVREGIVSNPEKFFGYSDTIFVGSG